MNKSRTEKFLRTAICIVAIIVGIFVVFAKDEGKPYLTFKEKSHSFGLIDANKGPVSTEFAFTNTGDSPLVIFDATADCGCTKPEYPKRPIAPGNSGVITVTFNPKGYYGSFTKSIKVKNNSEKRTIVLKISGKVAPSE